MKRVLVIDDNENTCDLIGEVLSENGYEVETSRDARAGFEIARNTVPDLIFISLMLTEINGLKVSKAIHSVKTLEKIPIIMLLANEGDLDVKYTATIGVIDTLVKPFNRAELLSKTAAAIGVPDAMDVSAEEIQEISIEEIEEPLMTAEEVPAMALDAVHIEGAEEDNPDYGMPDNFEATKEEQEAMPQKENPFEKNDSADDDLFSEEGDLFSKELKRSQDDLSGGQPSEEIPDYGPVTDYEDKPAMSLKRILFIAASIVVGIVLGVGGYLFFTAGSKQPVQKQAAKAAPEPAPLPPPAALTPEKPAPAPDAAVKPEPVKPEPVKPETVQPKATEPSVKVPAETPKKEHVQKTEPEKPKKEQAAVPAKPEQQKAAPVKQTKKEAAAGQGGKYYVQAGLFENEKNAETVVSQLKKHGYSPSVKKVESKDGKTLYRVVAGNYQGFKKAVEVSETLNRQGIKTIVHKQ